MRRRVPRTNFAIRSCTAHFLRCVRRRLAPTLAALAAATLVPAETASAQIEPDGPSAVRSRIVDRFEFEEAALVPVEFPERWRNLAEELGHPPFGRMRLSNDRAATGGWSFRFDPDGVPLAAGVPSGVLLVYPMTDYRIACRVRTEGLANATAQLVAGFAGPDGELIPESVHRSRAIRSEQAWDRLEVLVPGVHEDATSLVVELHLLQPERHESAPALDGVPPPPTSVDVSGHAWFDDVVIEHRTRVDLSVNGTGGIVVAPDAPRLRIAVRDLTTAGLSGELEVFDADGETVHTATVQNLGAGRPTEVDLPIDGFGWYRARLAVAAHGVPAGVRTLDFCRMPPRRPGAGTGAGPVIGLVLAAEHGRAVAETTELVRDSGAGVVTIPVWPPDDPQVAALAPLIARLLEHDVAVLAELARLRPEVARNAAVEVEQVAEAIAADAEGWREDLEPIAIAHGLFISDWIVGAIRPGPESFDPGPAPRTLEAVAERIAEVLPGPVPVVSRPSMVAGRRTGPGREIVRIPPWIRPADVGEAAADPESIVLLEPDPKMDGIDADIDLALRILHAWRAGHQTILVPAPWTPDPDPANGASVRPSLPILRTLSDTVGGHAPAGALRLGDGLHAWLVDGGESRRDALVVWRDGRAGDAPLPVPIRLGSDAVQSRGLRGDVRTVAPGDDGRHVLAVGPSPRIIEGINLDLLKFRASIDLVPNEIPAIYREHEIELVMRNPWPLAIAGTVFVTEADDRRLAPTRIPFSIQPGETFRRPMAAVFDRAIAAGKHPIGLEVLVEALDVARLRLERPIEIGWNDIDISATWTVMVDEAAGTRDLVIRMMVTNRGEEPVDLDAFLRGPGLGRERRPLARLAPGVTAVRRFFVPDGALTLGGETLRYGVSERGGPAQINRPLVMPAFDGSPGAATRVAVDP